MPNSIKKNFPECYIIMCYFHLKSNVRRYKSRIPDSEYSNIMAEISSLHMSKNQAEYRNLLEITLERWQSIASLKDFRSYFIKQWINSDFCNWQIFKTPSGFSKTYNPLEQYNCLIKEVFTKRLKQHLKSSLKVFKELISFKSDNLKEIKIVPRVTKLLRDTGTLISKSNLLIPIYNTLIPIDNTYYKYYY